ncbi:MAG: nicotinate (nicotinamide) nucleotide adenylyltransferase [Phycisphaerae bacterium]|nr:nicotinate (nicotinamide) nucleotide adenylyltransferase [Phycisphaerae bacterium]
MATRVGLYGGTFDPIHVGHLLVARAVRERLELDRLILIPSAHPPHKPVGRLTEAAHRLAMTKAAVDAEQGFEVSDCETKRSGPSYTIDTVAEYRRQLGGDAEIVWLIGSDTLQELAGWYRVAELVDACRFVVAPRPGCESPDLTSLGVALNPEQIDRLRGSFVGAPRIDVSATEIRRRVASGLSVRWMVPEPVRRYIVDHHLYTADR